MIWPHKHTTGFSSCMLAAAVLFGSILTGCEKEPVAEYAKPGVQLIPMNDTLRLVVAENTLLTNTHAWYIEDWVYITNEATLTIEPGAIIRIIGKKDTGAGLVVTRGAKIMASGLSNWPILFQLSNTSSSWSGIVLLGRAPQKKPYAPQASGWAYGGELPDDSSGVLKHIRIVTNPCKCDANEKQLQDGLLLMGVGRKTVVNDVVTDTNSNSPYRITAIPLK